MINFANMRKLMTSGKHVPEEIRRQRVDITLSKDTVKLIKDTVPFGKAKMGSIFIELSVIFMICLLNGKTNVAKSIIETISGDDIMINCIKELAQ